MEGEGAEEKEKEDRSRGVCRERRTSPCQEFFEHLPPTSPG